MAKLVAVDTAPPFAPRETEAATDRLIEGLPHYKTWDLDAAVAGTPGWDNIRTGIWEATPGKTVSLKGETFEFCHILSGRVVIAEDHGPSYEFAAGDSFVMKPGFVGTWTTIETVRKIFVIAA